MASYADFRALTAPRETCRGAGKRLAQRKGAAKTPEKRPAKTKVGHKWRSERVYIKKSHMQVLPRHRGWKRAVSDALGRTHVGDLQG